MKLQKFVKIAKRRGQCEVAHVGNSGIWLSAGAAVYRATELPELDGEDQVRVVLDMSEKEWEKVYFREAWSEGAWDVFGLNCASYTDDEQDVERVKVVAAVNEHWARCVRCKRDGELLFYDERLLVPFFEEIEGDYVRYTARETVSGQKYLVIHDGLDVLAAVLPVKVITEDFLGALDEFQALCTEQFFREKNREKTGENPVEPDEGEQLGMEE